jgi:outer membrane protein insertion porin family
MFFALLTTIVLLSYAPVNAQQEVEYQQEDFIADGRLITAVEVKGEVTVHQKMILNAFPYHIGDTFDPIKTRSAIRSLFALGYFENVRLYGKLAPDDSLILVIEVTEKKPLKDVVISGNTVLSDRDIFKKIPFKKITHVMKPELAQYVHKIKGLYHEKGYHDTSIETDLEEHDDGTVTAKFSVNEGAKTIVKRISFIGNHSISDKELRSTIITREDWLLSFMDKSGTYHPGKTEADKYKIEDLYQNAGFLNARVTEVKTNVDPATHYMHMTFIIDEGDRYYIGSIAAPGNDILSEEALLATLPARSGDTYSREKLMACVKRLESIWGDFGYVFAHISPSVQLNKETHTIDVVFHSEIGNTITLRKITIKGNNKTRDKVIRRALAVQEGAILTRRAMDYSKNNVTSLGYFDYNEGVNWKIIKQSADVADLDLVVKEAKTGHLGFQLSWGGSESSKASPVTGITGTAEFSDANLLGYGVQVNATVSWAKEDKNALLHIGYPWLFDKPIMGYIDIYHKRPSYNQLRHIVERSVYEIVNGGMLSLGYITPPWWQILNNVHIMGGVGVDSIQYEKRPVMQPLVSPLGTPPEIIAINNRSNIIYENLIAREFSPGEFFWLMVGAEQDMRNHPMHPSRGHKVKFSSRVALPSFNSNISFVWAELDAHWYTPLINERDLVLHLHGNFGVAQPLGNRNIPYGRLFHIGGDASVRGFGFGDISPSFQGDSLGAQKAFFVNTELIFPIHPNMTIKGLVFYDGGSGWDSPYIPTGHPDTFTNNSFDYRHAIGFGVRILQPMPIRIDWGFKIDPRKNESSHQVHFGTSFDW